MKKNESSLEEFVELLKASTPEEVKDIIIALRFFRSISTADMEAFKADMHKEGFDARAWLETQKALQQSN